MDTMTRPFYILVGFVIGSMTVAGISKTNMTWEGTIVSTVEGKPQTVSWKSCSCPDMGKMQKQIDALTNSADALKKYTDEVYDVTKIQHAYLLIVSSQILHIEQYLNGWRKYPETVK